MSENGVYDHWPTDQAQNIELSVNKQETANSSVCHTDSTKIALPSGSKGSIVSTSVAKRELPSDNMVSVSDNREVRKLSLEASGLRTKDSWVSISWMPTYLSGFYLSLVLEF